MALIIVRNLKSVPVSISSYINLKPGETRTFAFPLNILEYLSPKLVTAKIKGAIDFTTTPNSLVDDDALEGATISELEVSNITAIPKLLVGMQAPGRDIRLQFMAPQGVDFTIATKVLVVDCKVRTTGEPFSLSPWVPTNVTANAMQMQFDPNGTEFVRPGLPGQLRINGVLTLDGIPYDIRGFFVNVIPM